MSDIIENDHIEDVVTRYALAAVEFERIVNTLGVQSVLQPISRPHDGEPANIVYVEKELVEGGLSVRVEHICNSVQKLRCIIMITAKRRNEEKIDTLFENLATLLSDLGMFLYDYEKAKPLYEDKTGIFYYKYGKVVV